MAERRESWGSAGTTERLNFQAIPASPKTLCAAVNEEHAYRGILKFLELDMPVSTAVVGELTEF